MELPAKCDTEASQNPGAEPSPRDWIERLIDAHQERVWRYLRSLGCDCAMADDLTQETFLAVYRHPFHEINAAASASYLRRVAYHLLIAHRRKFERVELTHNPQDLESEWMRWAGFDSSDSIIDHLKECMQRLTDRAQFALNLRFAHNASREEIATSLGIGAHGAKNLMQRAKLQLRECIESRLP